MRRLPWSGSRSRSLDEAPVEHLLRKRLALEFQELKILFHVTIERKANLPGPCEDLGVLDRRFVHHVEGASVRVAVYHVKLIAVIVYRAIEPPFLSEPGHVADQRFNLSP